MTLSKVTWLAIRGMSLAEKDELAAMMGITTNRLYYWLKTRSDNFTKAANLQVLSRVLGIPEELLIEYGYKDQA